MSESPRSSNESGGLLHEAVEMVKKNVGLVIAGVSALTLTTCFFVGVISLDGMKVDGVKLVKDGGKEKKDGGKEKKDAGIPDDKEEKDAGPYESFTVFYAGNSDPEGVKTVKCRVCVFRVAFRGKPSPEDLAKAIDRAKNDALEEMKSKGHRNAFPLRTEDFHPGTPPIPGVLERGSPFMQDVTKHAKMQQGENKERVVYIIAANAARIDE
ncbi:MAG: hypothetical protein HOO67_02390 [Candidatus Peribacteraceae bacterium]|nr:hypothetical protein [Candidatus Peribacteraceae bacterium]